MTARRLTSVSTSVPFFGSLIATTVLSLGLMVLGCSSSSKGNGSGGSNASGGKSSSGGATASGGNGSGGNNASGGNSASGGANGSGGASANGGSSGTCSNGTTCGGDVVGTWNVTSSCINVSGQLDLSFSGTGPSCRTAPVTGSLQVTGTWTVKADGTYQDATVTTGQEKFTLTSSCLVISSTPVKCDGAAGLLAISLGFEKLTCTDSAGGGCDCQGTIKQDGGMAFPAQAPSTDGSYTLADNVITTADGPQYASCVSNGKLTLTPKSDKPTMTGTIVLQKSGSSGSGGQSGSGGTQSSGGAGGGKGGSPGGGGTGSGGASAAGGSGGASNITGPCDIYAAGNTPCVAAHSMVRALYGSYNGKLYQVRKTDKTTKDILTLSAGGIADTAPLDEFCAGSTCIVMVVYDQSGKGNDLWYQGSDQVPASPRSTPAKATTESLTVSGHKVYSLYINPTNCYWHDGTKSGMPTGAQPEGMYMVTSGKHANGGCCFDYGNSETDRSADGAGAMDAINFSTTTAWGSGAGSGPWVMADLEYGLFTQGNNGKNPNDPTQTNPYVTAVLKNNGTTEYALRGGDSTAGKLSTYYKGALPGGWSPMKKQGALILGCGGDCCKPSGGANDSAGTFYEGAIVTGYPTDATEDAIQANIVAAGYGK